MTDPRTLIQYDHEERERLLEAIRLAYDHQKISPRLSPSAGSTLVILADLKPDGWEVEFA